MRVWQITVRDVRGGWRTQEARNRWALRVRRRVTAGLFKDFKSKDALRGIPFPLASWVVRGELGTPVVGMSNEGTGFRNSEPEVADWYKRSTEMELEWEPRW